MQLVAVAVSFPVFLASVVAQAPTTERAIADPTTARVERIGGVVHGSGHDYTALFGADGMTFLPTAGEAAVRPLHYRLDGVRRGSQAVWTRRADCAPAADGDVVRHAHDGGPVEQYDVRDDGVEQSFVFATRPGGNGDLVVHGTITTELPLLAADDDGARFGSPRGGVAFGAVTGIDANGATVRGGVRIVGTSLELSLPATFVDDAAYPLVLDPLIGPVISIANGTAGPDVQSRVAYDATNQRWLVVWNVEVSATTAEVRGAFVSAAGQLGPQILLTSTAVAGVRPAIANVNQRNRFVVAWSAVGGFVVHAAAVDAANGAVSSWITFSYPTPNFRVTGIALGGDSRAAGDDVLLLTAYEDLLQQNSAVLFSTLEVPSMGAPTYAANGVVFPPQPYEYGEPSIGRHAGNQGRWPCAIGWRNLASGAHGVSAWSVDTAGNPCDGDAWQYPVAPSSPLHTAVGNVDGNQFLVAYTTSDQDFLLRRGTYSGTCAAGTMSIGPAFSPGATSSARQYPELDCTGNRYVLTYRQASTTTGYEQVRVIGVGLGSGAGASELAQGTTASHQTDPAVSARWTAGDTGSEEALLVWSNTSIRGRRWEATGTGTVTNLGGACGLSGLSDFASYTGTPALGTTFTIDLVAPTSPILALVIGFTAAPLPCGPCTLVPSVDVVLAGVTPTPITVPLDAGLIGAELIAQWLQLRPGGCPLAPTYGASNTLKFTIAE